MAGLKVNVEKTKIIKLQTNQQIPFSLEEYELKGVESFTHLGSLVTTTGGADEDVKHRIGKARYAFNVAKPEWRGKTLLVKSIFNTNKCQIYTFYGSETWRMINTISNK